MERPNLFSSGEQGEILRFVREVIVSAVTGMPEPNAPECGGKLKQPGSCFVTLHTFDGMLRGCIGSLSTIESLGDNLRRNALNAAFRDPRFPPVDADEVEELSIEVSVLTPPEAIASPEEFVLGEEGIIVHCPATGHSAVFLPQVPVEQRWDRATTLNYLCQKAGLPADEWRRRKLNWSVFRAEVFGETQIPEEP